MGLKDVAEPVIKVGPYPCVNVTVNSEENVECSTSPGVSRDNKVTLTVLGVANVEEDKLFRFDYKVPVVTNTVGETPWYGNTTLLIFGRHLSSEDGENLQVKIGGVSCLELEVLNEDELACVIPPGRGKQAIEIIDGSVSSFDGNANKTYVDYAPPLIERLALPYGPSYGNSSIVVVGKYLAHPKLEQVGDAFDTEIAINGKDCLKVTVISEERVMCEIPNGKPGVVDVEVTGFGSTSLHNNASKFTYEPPKVLEMFPRHGKFYGNTNLTLVGNNFGSRYTKTSVTVDGLPCKNVKVLSSRMLRCLTPPGDQNMLALRLL